MGLDAAALQENFEIRPLIGLTHGLSKAEIESLTIDAIRTHRRLVEEADLLFQALPEDYQTGKASGGDQYLTYIKSCIDMHAQMYVVNTLITVLGFIPKVTVN